MLKSLRHRRAQSRLDAYVDHELPTTVVAVIETHLAECPECRRAIAAILKLKASLRRLRREDSVVVRRLQRWARTELPRSAGGHI